MPVVLIDPNEKPAGASGGGKARVIGEDTAPGPSSGDNLRQVLSSGLTGLADTPAFLWSLLGGMASFGADPLTEAPPPRTLSDLVTGKPAAEPALPPAVPGFSSEDVAPLIGLPKMD